MTWKQLEEDILSDIELIKLDERPSPKELMRLVTIVAIAHDKAKDEKED